MLKKLLIVAAISAISVTAFASDAARAEAKQVIDLKDGSTIYVFKDGNGRQTWSCRSHEERYGNGNQGRPEDLDARRRSHASR